MKEKAMKEKAKKAERREKPPKPPKKIKASKRPKRPRREKHSRRQRASGESLFNYTSQTIHDAFVRLIGNLRFSLGLRISTNYARLLISMFFSNLFWLFIAFCVWQTPLLLARNAEVVRAVQASPGVPLSDIAYLPFQDSVKAELIAGRAPVSEDAFERAVIEFFGAVQDITIEGWHPIVTLEVPVERGDQPYRLRTLHDLSDTLMLFLYLMAALLVFDILRAFGFLVRGRRINRRVLQPIADITAHAQMLSENELSLRLNVAGAKNELKDLAMVFNAMLDRIEAAYNGQKQFVSDASHELRTPIAVIQGYANLLERWGKDDAQVRDESISAIVNETANMKDLVEKLLFLARHDKKTFKLNLEHFDLRELMEETVRETEMITANHRVETGEISGGILYADRNAIKQAIRVFIDNAVKYTPPGGTIRIACERTPGTVSIAISDTGLGISRGDLQNIFERFYRADTARNGKESGHGLGLAIARIIVISHGGKIRVSSTVGEGSTFRILLPN